MILYVVMIFLIIADLVCAEQRRSLDQQQSREPSSFWIEAEYLLWSIKKNPVPVPLLTSASNSDPLPGAIGQPGTKVLLGQSHFHMGWMNGFRVSAGAAVYSRFGIEGNYFLLPTTAKKKSFGTSGLLGSPDFAVPLFDVTGICGLNGIPGETIFLLPGPFSDGPGFFGEFDFRITSRLQGSELNGIYHLFEGGQFYLDGIGGFRWLQLRESLIFKAKTHSIASSPVEFFNFSDRFFTSNNFLAAQIGIDGQYRRKKWKLEAEFKGALGAVLEQIKIKGTCRTSNGNIFFKTQGTANEILPGGIFAEPSNDGKHTKSNFAYAFEAHVNSGYKLTRNLEINVGYTFLWLSKVLRPGKQIDRKVNTTLTALADASRSTVGIGPGPIPFGNSSAAPAPRGPKEPSVSFKTNSFYAQGLDVGVTLLF